MFSNKVAWQHFDLSYKFNHKYWKALTNIGYLNSFRLLCFILTYSKALVWFCCSFNLRSSIFCWNVFWDFDCELYRFLRSSCGTLCIVSWVYWERTFYAPRNAQMKFFLRLHPYTYKTLTLKKNSWLLQFYSGTVHQKLYRSNRACFNLALHQSENLHDHE